MLSRWRNSKIREKRRVTYPQYSYEALGNENKPRNRKNQRNHRN